MVQAIGSVLLFLECLFLKHIWILKQRDLSIMTEGKHAQYCQVNQDITILQGCASPQDECDTEPIRSRVPDTTISEISVSRRDHERIKTDISESNELCRGRE